VLSEGNPPKPAILSAINHAGTQAFTELMHAVTDKKLANELLEFESQVLSYIYDYDLAHRLTMINSKSKVQQKRAIKDWSWFVQAIERMSNEQVNEQQGRRAKKRDAQAPHRSYPVSSDLVGDWEPLVVSKPELSINHTGKLGRRVIASDSGREIRYLNRMVSDPDKRVFSRKTRALGGVVVIDASGSMHLSEDDLDRLLKASAGATVLMYSGGYNNPNKPNAWVIARKGRMVRRLPDVPGDNACDGPALIYAASLRDRGSQPVIWVSDGYVTGINAGHTNRNLLKDIENITRKHRIVRVNDVQEAEKLMKRLQGGSR
jgi:hypothetical protein